MSNQKCGNTVGAYGAGLFIGCLFVLAANEGRAQLVTGKVPVGALGHELYYEVQGAGEPVVLIHGLTLDLRMWDDQVSALADHYRVIRYDVEGHGRSSGLSANLATGSVRDWEYLRDLLDQLGIEKAHIAGLSMGGGIAINFAITYPDRVQTLTTMDSRISGYNAPSALGTRFSKYLDVSGTQGVQAALPLWANDPLFAPANSRPEVRDRLEQMVIEGHGSLRDGATFQWPNMLKIADPSPSALSRLRQIIAPTQVMVGDLDLIDFQLQADSLDANIPDSTKVVVPNAGHMSNMENPIFVNAALLDFFAAHPITPTPGDFTGDGVIDAADLAQWKNNFGVDGGSDADHDGDSDGADFLIWQRHLGSPALAVSANTPVPEPATSTLLIVAAVGIRRIGGRMRQELVSA